MYLNVFWASTNNLPYCCSFFDTWPRRILRSKWGQRSGWKNMLARWWKKTSCTTTFFDLFGCFIKIFSLFLWHTALAIFFYNSSIVITHSHQLVVLHSSRNKNSWYYWSATFISRHSLSTETHCSLKIGTAEGGNWAAICRSMYVFRVRANNEFITWSGLLQICFKTELNNCWPVSWRHVCLYKHTTEVQLLFTSREIESLFRVHDTIFPSIFPLLGFCVYLCINKKESSTAITTTRSPQVITKNCCLDGFFPSELLRLLLLLMLLMLLQAPLTHIIICCSYRLGMTRSRSVQRVFFFNGPKICK